MEILTETLSVVRQQSISSLCFNDLSKASMYNTFRKFWTSLISDEKEKHKEILACLAINCLGNLAWWSKSVCDWSKLKLWLIDKSVMALWGEITVEWCLYFFCSVLLLVCVETSVDSPLLLTVNPATWCCLTGCILCTIFDRWQVIDRTLPNCGGVGYKADFLFVVPGQV